MNTCHERGVEPNSFEMRSAGLAAQREVDDIAIGLPSGVAGVRYSPVQLRRAQPPMSRSIPAAVLAQTSVVAARMPCYRSVSSSLFTQWAPVVRGYGLKLLLYFDSKSLRSMDSPIAL